MSDNRMRVWFALFVLVVFCAGLAGGIIIDRVLSRRAYFDRGGRQGMVFGPGAPGPGGPRRGGPPARILVDRLSDELDLTADQRAKIEAVLVAHRTSLEAVQRDVRDRFEAEQRSLHEDIRKVLTPEQQEKFDKSQQERSRRRGR